MEIRRSFDPKISINKNMFRVSVQKIEYGSYKIKLKSDLGLICYCRQCNSTTFAIIKGYKITLFDSAFENFSMALNLLKD